MKSIFPVVVFSVLLAAAGCEHLDVSPQGDPERVLNGTVAVPAALPAGTEIIVRIVDLSPTEAPGVAAKNDLPVASVSRPAGVERVLGEFRETLDDVTTEPVTFRVEYRADDGLLRHGLNVDVRISYGGRVRYRTISAHVVTLASSPFRHEVPVQAVQ